MPGSCVRSVGIQSACVKYLVSRNMCLEWKDSNVTKYCALHHSVEWGLNPTL